MGSDLEFLGGVSDRFFSDVSLRSPYLYGEMFLEVDLTTEAQTIHRHRVTAFLPSLTTRELQSGTQLKDLTRGYRIQRARRCS